MEPIRPIRKVSRQIGLFKLQASLEGGELKMELISHDAPNRFTAKFNADSLPPQITQIFYNLENTLVCLGEEKL